MDLKELLGEELYNQVIEKAGDNKLAIVSDGTWFPKDKFDTVNNDNKELKKQLKLRDDQLEELKKIDADGLQQRIKDLQDANEKVKEDYEKQIKQQQFDFTLEKAIAAAQAKNPKAVKALLNLENIKLDGDKLIGFEDQLTALKTSDGYLFGEDSKLGGRKPNDNNNPPPGTKNPFSKEHFNLTEQARILKEDPELAKQLKALA